MNWTAWKKTSHHLTSSTNAPINLLADQSISQKIQTSNPKQEQKRKPISVRKQAQELWPKLANLVLVSLVEDVPVLPSLSLVLVCRIRTNPEEKDRIFNAIPNQEKRHDIQGRRTERARDLSRKGKLRWPKWSISESWAWVLAALDPPGHRMTWLAKLGNCLISFESFFSVPFGSKALFLQCEDRTKF